MKQYVRAAQALAIVLLMVLAAFYWPWLTNQKSFYLVDICQHWHPFFEYIGDTLRHGRYPMWNPYLLCGASQLSVISPSPYYFVSLLFAWLPFNSALASFFVLNQIVAGVGMFLLVAAADWGVAAALLAGVAFALCSLLFSLETSCALQATAAWFPLCLWSIFRLGQASQRKQLGMLVGASFLVLLLIVPGVPEVFAPEIMLIVAWSILLWARAAGDSQRTKALMLRFLAVGAGILLAMPELVPCIEWIPKSDRAWGLDINEVLEWSVNWFDLIGIVLPHPLGDQQLIDNQFVGLTADAVNSVARYITSSYLGPVILSLSIVGFSDKTWRSRWWILSALVLFLTLAMGRNCPPAAYLFHVSQFHWLRYPIKLMAFVVMCVFLSAARGVVALQRREDGLPNSVINCAVAWGVLLVGALLLQSPEVAETFSQSFSRAIGVVVSSSGEVKAALGLIALDAIPHLLLGLATCGVIFLLYRGKVREKIAFSTALLVIAGSYLWQALTLFHHAGPSDFYSTQLALKPAIDRAAVRLGRSGGIRINSLFNQFGPPPSYHYTWDDRTVDAYQFSRQLFCVPTNIGAGFGQPLGVVVGQTAENYRIAGYVHNQYSAGQDDVPLWNYCKLTATDFVVQPELEYRTDGVMIATHRPLSSQRFEQIDYNRSLRTRTYRVKGALPRAYFPETIKWGEPHESVVRFVAMSEQTGFDPSRLAILEHNQTGELGRTIAAAAVSGPTPRAEFMLDEPEHIRLKVSTPRDNYLILADTFYPGWSAAVDGSSTEISRANAMMRAVFVPAGLHVVEFTYSPISLKLGIALAILAVLIVAGVAVVPAFRFTPPPSSGAGSEAGVPRGLSTCAVNSRPKLDFVQAAVRESNKSSRGGAAVAVLVLTVALLSILWPLPSAQFKESDTFWLIEVGRNILHHFALPSSDPYSFGASSSPWILYQWLTEVIFALANTAGLIGVAIVGVVTLSWLLCVLIFRRALELGANAIVSLVVLIIAIQLTSPDVATLRPQLFSFVFLFLLQSLLEQVWSEGATRRQLLYVLIKTFVIGVLWANCHVSFPLGLLMASVYLLAALFDKFIRHNEDKHLPTIFACMSAAFLFATLINPYGVALWGFVKNLDSMYVTQEMRPMDLSRAAPYLIMLLSTVKLWKRVALPRLIVAVLLFACGCMHARLIIYFCLSTCPLIAESVSAMLPGLAQQGRLIVLNESIRRLAFNKYYPVAAIGIAIFSVLLQPLRIPRSIPWQAADYLAVNKPTGNLFCSAHAGSYLIYRFQGSVKVFMDTRIDRYDPALCRRFVGAMDGDGWKELFQQYDISEILLPRTCPLNQEIEKSSDWKNMYRDNDFSVSIRATGE